MIMFRIDFISYILLCHNTSGALMARIDLLIIKCLQLSVIVCGVIAYFVIQMLPCRS